MGIRTTATEVEAGTGTFRIRFADGTESAPRSAAVVDLDEFVQTLVEEIVFDGMAGKIVGELVVETSEARTTIPFVPIVATSSATDKIHLAPRSAVWPKRKDPVESPLVKRVRLAIARDRSPGAHGLATAVLTEVADYLDEARQNVGWRIDLPNYNGCSDLCAMCLVEWIRAQIERAS